MSIRNHAIRGAIKLTLLSQIGVPLMGALLYIVYNNLTTRIDEVKAKGESTETRLNTQEEAILNVANNVYLLCKAQKNTECIAPDKPVK